MLADLHVPHIAQVESECMAIEFKTGTVEQGGGGCMCPPNILKITKS